MVNEITTETFASDIQEDCVVDFYTPDCPMCNKLGPVFEKVAGEVSGTKFFKVNLEEDMSLAEELHINHVPTVILFQDGMPVKTSVGFMEEEKLTEFVQAEGTI